MGPTVNTVDDEVTPVLELISQTFGGDSSHDRGDGRRRVDDIKVPPLVRECTLHSSARPSLGAPAQPAG